MKNSIKQLFDDVRTKNPLIHHITNTVTMNDCANVTLAIGGSPVMADSPEEAPAMTELAQALVINFGTIATDTFQAMIKAGKAANHLGIPVIFDPVGVGATSFRTEKAKELLKEVNIQLIRGNVTEVMGLLGLSAETRGVDAGKTSIDRQQLATKAAQEFRSIVVISGKIDVISDGQNIVSIANGHEMLTKITGTGCMTASLIGCFAGVTENFFHAAIAGISIMSIAGERAVRSLRQGEGVGTFKVKLFDEISSIDGGRWEEEVNFK
ncbi:hydroxyethylthiazole kinase [Bacillus aquiflavi]|uniref:Hydroxyethylthiazole kinase n=1 Tax=Bacillus aquiflavi TaxID=2672567 RepID=A0A6B3W0P6_9BACI|nr:hydroxyethylthiazole kinase [Bacillus aquiflavi]MBA4536777.1 hydroxyethylthiazole kinase [Bacillus aquiflavi]NEY81144.1 hydroxyethylthiazole kinase [Bacillus aquiflavi]